MMGSKLRPKVVLWWGIGLTLGGVLFTLALPQLGFEVLIQPILATGVDHGLLTLLDLAVRIVAQVMTPLGVVLIGAAVVMAYVDRSLATHAREDERAAARPRRNAGDEPSEVGDRSGA